jgi:hypothetical protein
MTLFLPREGKEPDQADLTESGREDSVDMQFGRFWLFPRSCQSETNHSGIQHNSDNTVMAGHGRGNRAGGAACDAFGAEHKAIKDSTRSRIRLGINSDLLATIAGNVKEEGGSQVKPKLDFMKRGAARPRPRPVTIRRLGVISCEPQIAATATVTPHTVQYCIARRHALTTSQPNVAAYR